MTLPTPGPGRPQHPSYSEPGPLFDLVDLGVLILIVVLFGGLYALVEAVV